MKSKSELAALYETHLKPKLASLEHVRKKLMRSYLIIVGGIGISIAGLILINPQSNSAQSWMTYAFIAIIIACIAFLISTSFKKKKYRTQFKSQVVSEIVAFINPEWNYMPDQMISTIDYQQSDLFRTHYHRYRGDDYISGVIDKTDFKCSELHTEYKTVSTDSKGRRQETWHTIFKGLFLHADFNKKFSGKTYVTPDYAEKLFGKWGQKLQKYSGNGTLVKLENPEFEKEFVVHATNQIEARYILTPVMMEALLAIKKQYNKPVYFSFSGNRVYCAMSFSKDLFEPKIFSSGVNINSVSEMYNLFMLNETIIKELNLNTRIWTKE